MVLGRLWLSILIALGAPKLMTAQDGCNGVRTLAGCPVTGCAKRGSDEALFNGIKRRQARQTRPVRLFFTDFKTLQRAADAGVGQDVTLTKTDRQTLKAVVTNGTIAEGRLIKVVGFIAAGSPGPHANSSGESVNCKLQNQGNNDFHISLVERQGQDEFAAIVVEMIPQRRPAGWTIPKLRKIQRNGQKVLITGALFYDNEHRVNSESRSPIGGQPKRFSLWELHPIKDFFVCLKPGNRCNETRLNEWTTLVAFTER
jgi:hypothetical protein